MNIRKEEEDSVLLIVARESRMSATSVALPCLVRRGRRDVMSRD